MREDRWDPVRGSGLLMFGAGVALLLAALRFSEPGFIPILDHANLLFHEAGHPLVGLMSSRLEPYGGTLGQLFFPCALAFSCWRKGKCLGAAAAALWLFENGFNIARYMADARALELPLVGGGDHDWNTILNRWGILHRDVEMASIIRNVSWLGIALVCGWLAWRAWKDRKHERLSETGQLPYAER